MGVARITVEIETADENVLDGAEALLAGLSGAGVAPADWAAVAAAWIDGLDPETVEGDALEDSAYDDGPTGLILKTLVRYLTGPEPPP